MQEVKSKNIPRFDFGFGTIIWKIAIDCGLHNESFCSFLPLVLFYFFVAHQSEANNAIMGSDIAHHEEFLFFIFFEDRMIVICAEKESSTLEGPLLHRWLLFRSTLDSHTSSKCELDGMQARAEAPRHDQERWRNILAWIEQRNDGTTKAKFIWKI